MNVKDTIKKANEFIECGDYKRAGNILLELDACIDKGNLTNIVDRFRYLERPITKDMLQYSCFLNIHDAEKIINLLYERHMFLDYRLDDLYHIKHSIDYRMYTIGQANLKEILGELLFCINFDFIDDDGIKSLILGTESLYGTRKSRIEHSREILDEFKTERLKYSNVSHKAANYYIENVIKGNLRIKDVDKRTELLIREAFRELAEKLDNE